MNGMVVVQRGSCDEHALPVLRSSWLQVGQLLALIHAGAISVAQNLLRYWASEISLACLK